MYTTILYLGNALIQWCVTRTHTQRAYCCFVDCIWLSFWPFLCFRGTPLSAYECTKGRWKLSMASAFVGIKGEMLACAAFASAIPWHPGGWVHSYRSNKAKVTPHNGRLPNKIECPLTQISQKDQKVLNLLQQSIGLQVEAYSTASQSDFNIESWFSGMLVNDVDSKGCHDVQMVDTSSLADNSTFSRIGLWFTGSRAENTAQLSAQGFIFVSLLDHYQERFRPVHKRQWQVFRSTSFEPAGASCWVEGSQQLVARPVWVIKTCRFGELEFECHVCEVNQGHIQPPCVPHHAEKEFLPQEGHHSRWSKLGSLSSLANFGEGLLAPWVRWSMDIGSICKFATITYKQTQIAHVQGIASRIGNHGEPTDDHFNVECRYCCV